MFILNVLLAAVCTAVCGWSAYINYRTGNQGWMWFSIALAAWNGFYLVLGLSALL